MYHQIKKLLCCLFVLGIGLPGWGKTSTSGEMEGYRAIAVFGYQFLAVGTKGRIDRINTTGNVVSIPNTCSVNLNGVICENRNVIVVGDSGTILHFNNGKNYRKVCVETKNNINCISSFNGILIAGADAGTILIHEVGDNWRNIQIPVRGDILSICADTTLCIGVTNKGEIIKSTNGFDWDIFDYNTVYKGYNKPCIFKSILIAGSSILIAGEHEDRTPVVLFSALGNVWTERILNYKDMSGTTNLLTNKINAVSYDATNDSFYLACNDGVIISLPSCSQCNKLFTVNNTALNGISCFRDILMVVGDNYNINNISLR